MKLAASRLRELVSVAPFEVRKQKGFDLLLAGQRIGEMLLKNKQQVASTSIDSKYRGMGLGKKFYGEVMKTLPGHALESDSHVSEKAAPVWRSMLRRGYAGSERASTPSTLHVSGEGNVPGRWSGGEHGIFRAELPMKKHAEAKEHELEKATHKKHPPKKYKLEGHMSFQGLRIAVENKIGSTRSGHDKDGKPWHTLMKAAYGYIVGSKGADDEGVDCYVGPNKDAPNAYVVHQKREDGSYDEDKVMLGCSSLKEARELYLIHYNTEKFLGPIKEVPMERLKALLSEKKTLTKISSVMYAGFVDELTAIWSSPCE